MRAGKEKKKTTKLTACWAKNAVSVEQEQGKGRSQVTTVVKTEEAVLWAREVWKIN